LLGLEREALAFFHCLAALYDRELAGGASSISPETFQFWRNAVVGIPQPDSVLE
jgi:hypothetical protein